MGCGNKLKSKAFQVLCVMGFARQVSAVAEAPDCAGSGVQGSVHLQAWCQIVTKNVTVKLTVLRRLSRLRLLLCGERPESL